METYFLIVVLGINNGFGHGQYGMGGASIAPTTSLEQCHALLMLTRSELKRHKKIDMKEVTLTCKKA